MFKGAKNLSIFITLIKIKLINCFNNFVFLQHNKMRTGTQCGYLGKDLKINKSKIEHLSQF